MPKPCSTNAPQIGQNEGFRSGSSRPNRSEKRDRTGLRATIEPASPIQHLTLQFPCAKDALDPHTSTATKDTG